MEKVILAIAKAIEDSEFAGNSYVVGGFVRDRIMGKLSNDLDIVVAVDKGGINLAERLYKKGVSSRPVIFKNFGTAFVLMENYKVEFVMTRQESYRGGSRKPDVKAGTLEDDIFRRDFTINSLLMNISTGEIIDITGKAKDDIKAKIIRATSEVNKLFTEDPLRMIRAVRFSNQLGFKIEEKTLTGIISNSDKLGSISWERRRDEFQKILLTQSPVTGIRMLLDLNLMKSIIPEFMTLDGMKQNKYHYLDGLEHTLEVLKGTSNNLIVRLAAILHDIGKPVVRTEDSIGIHFYNHEEVGAELSEKILRRLRFPLESVKRVKKLILNHMRLKSSGINGALISDKGIRRLLLEMGDDFELLLELIGADNAAHAEQYRSKNQVTEILRRALEIKINLTKLELPLKGRDIIEYFEIRPGKVIGDLLKQAEDIWLGHPQFDKEVILKELKKIREATMTDQESKVTKTVREGVNKALEVGEDFIQALGRITKEVVVTIKEDELSTKEKVSKLANEALDGAKQSAKNVQPQTEEFVRKASKSIVDSIKVSAPKVAHFAQEALKGMYEGAKNYYDQKKETKEEESESEK